MPDNFLSLLSSVNGKDALSFCPGDVLSVIIKCVSSYRRYKLMSALNKVVIHSFENNWDSFSIVACFRVSNLTIAQCLFRLSNPLNA
jgi:hypothetical protein